MNRDSSFSKSPREDTKKSEKKCKAFKDISKYFSKKEWAEMSYSKKITCVYMKRNYTTMSSLGLRATMPAFIHSNGQAMESQDDDSDEGCYHGSQGDPFQRASGVQQRKCPKMPKKPAKDENNPKGMLGAHGSEQAQRYLYPLGEASTSVKCNEKTSGSRKRRINIWSHRLRERKNFVVYEEISDPEEESDNNEED